MARDDRVRPGGPRVPELPLPEVPWRPGNGRPPRGHDAVPGPLALARGADLFDAGFWWEAHEVWEGRWVSTPNPSVERDLLQGLIQVAAYLIKVRDGLLPAADRLRGRALVRLDAVVLAEGPVVAGLDIGRLCAEVRAHGPGSAPIRLVDVKEDDRPADGRRRKD